MQKKLTVLFAFAIFVLLVGWAVTPAQAEHCKGKHKTDPGCDGGGGGGGGTIPVTVFIVDAVGDGLMSDGIGHYIDRVDKVSVGIGSTVGLKGQLAMHLGVRGNQPAIRQLFLDFTHCVSEDIEGMTTCTPPSLPDDLTPGPTNLYTSGVNLKEMVVNDTTSSALNMSVNIDLNSIDQGIWTLFFYYSSFADCQDGTKVGVTRTGDDTWVIEAGRVFGAVACLAQNVGAKGYEFRGRYFMPFQMEVRKK